MPFIVDWNECLKIKNGMGQDKYFLLTICKFRPLIFFIWINLVHSLPPSGNVIFALLQSTQPQETTNLSALHILEGPENLEIPPLASQYARRIELYLLDISSLTERAPRTPSTNQVGKDGCRHDLLRCLGRQDRCHRVRNQEGISQAGNHYTSRQVPRSSASWTHI